MNNLLSAMPLLQGKSRQIWPSFV